MTTTGNRYNLFDPETGSLDRRVFTDQAIYDEEMEKIFGRSWLMVAHESLVPKKNDFFLSYMEMGMQFMTASSLDPRDRELAILRTGWLCGAPYEWGEHVDIGKRYATLAFLQQIRITCNIGDCHT